MDDTLSLTRCQQEESQAARMIYSTGGLYNHFIKCATPPTLPWGARPHLDPTLLVFMRPTI